VLKLRVRNRGIDERPVKVVILLLLILREVIPGAYEPSKKVKLLPERSREVRDVIQEASEIVFNAPFENVSDDKDEQP